MQAYDVCWSSTFKGTSRFGKRRGPIGGVAVESIRRPRVKLLIAGAAASGLVAIGAVAAVAVGQQQTGTINGSPMTIGGTATTTTPPSVAPTANASPTMKAPRPKGF
jgi:hypothetical protein